MPEEGDQPSAGRSGWNQPAPGELPALGEGEYYFADLLGLPRISTDGSDLGTCVAVENFGAGDVLEIQLPPEDGKPGKKFMVPMNAQAVPEWGERIVIDAAFVA